jgi:penicillin-binding protein 2
MWNRLTSAWLTEDANPSRGWDPDHAPRLRLSMLWVSMLLPLLAVATRMSQLQLGLRDDFVTGFEQTYEVREEIPARDGRILAADGSVLAGEVERYDLQMNYRLIQEPADVRWLRGEALRVLSRTERRNKSLVEAEEQRVLERRDELWMSVSRLTGRDPAELNAVRQSVQQRVGHIKLAVLRARERRLARNEGISTATPTPTATADVSSRQTWPSGWDAVWNRLRRELTEPPNRRTEAGPIAEEEDFHTVVPGVDADVKAEIEAHPDRYPNVRVFVQTRRTYPQGEVASHLIGSRTPLTEKELKERRARHADAVESAYQVGDPIGRSGLELEYERHLHGVRGERRLIKNRRGEVVGSEVLREPQHGRDLVLTLDLDVQRRAERLLDEALATVTLPDAVDDQSNRAASTASQPSCPQGGCLVAIDVHSGAILAAASAPRFDLNLLISSRADQWRDLMADPRKPLFSRATQMALAPGSVFKIVSAVAGVESGKMPADEPFLCRGFLDRPDQHRCLTYRHYGVGHGETQLADALCRSCNVYFFTAARRMGPQTLVDWAARMGFGQATGVDLPSESAGHLPSPNEVIDGRRRRWNVGETLGLAIGQADLLVTPLQMVRAMAAVANDGLLVTPHLAGESGPVSLEESRSFRPVFPHSEPTPIAGLHRGTLAHVREGLEMVVQNPRGTGFKTVRLNDVRIAGKTGTAETHGIDHAWFAGYAPADHPRVAFVVVLEHGGSGGKAAGPVARKFVSGLLELGLVTPAADLAGDIPIE